MNKEKVGGAIALAASLPLMMLALTTPIANAATVSSTVTAIDVCEWQMAGAPETIELTSASKYEGAALEVSYSTSDLALGLSGSQSNTAITGTSTECSFYNNRETASVSFTLISTNAFTATYGGGTRDANMDFTLGGGNSLDVSATLSTQCSENGWATAGISFTSVDALDALLQIPSAEVVNKYAASDNGAERCNPELTIAVDIPASANVPAGAGQAYSFSGPSLEIALATTNVGQ